MYRDDLATIEHLREENLRLQMMIASFESSRSWRTTAPFRRYAAFLRAHHILPEISQKLSRGLLSTYEWQDDTHLNLPTTPRIAVLAHIYYPELADEIAAAARECGPDAIVIVTYVNPEVLPHIKSSFTDHHISNVEYILVENLGRDMWPMLQALKSKLLDDMDAILKIHTKKSLHLEKGKGDAWRKSLINGLVPSHTAVTNLAAEFARNPRLAWACPTEWVAGNESWGRNKRTVTQLMGQCGLKRPRSLVFPAGSMFWMGRELRACLLALELTRDNFSETPALDGSFEHGLERFIGSWSLATQGIMYRTQHQSTNRNRPEYALQFTNDRTDEQH
ncbi:MAG: hypothetical protein RLZZ426_1210 [Actinomycetota bacterium]|jgi:lipopolysaccharide biosynthesis protein